MEGGEGVPEPADSPGWVSSKTCSQPMILTRNITRLAVAQAVIVHQLSKRKSQNPFRKNRGRVQLVKFHPSKPFFFVATSNHVRRRLFPLHPPALCLVPPLPNGGTSEPNSPGDALTWFALLLEPSFMPPQVRVYNLAKQSLAKKLVGGSGVITSLDVHSGGDNLIVGCEDNRLMWFDMDLSTKPYRFVARTGRGGTGPVSPSCARTQPVMSFTGHTPHVRSNSQGAQVPQPAYPWRVLSPLVSFVCNIFG